jgi:uncharacterized protein (TIGR03435 family)
MIRWTALALLPVIGTLHVPVGHAQGAAKRPEFEVASIKPDRDCNRGLSSHSPGRLNEVCGTLRQEIGVAYGTFDGSRLRWPRLEVVGGPRWLDTDKYDILGKAEGAAHYWQMASLMMQSLLEERCNLKVHTEARETTVYVLTVARSEPRLKRTEESGCIALDIDNSQDTPIPNVRTSAAPGGMPCGSGRVRPDGPNLIADWYGISMAEFAGYGLPGRVGRTVVDRTGLTGLFDIHLEYSRDLPPGTPIPDSSVAPKPDIFKALQEQLGLKLTPAKAPVEVVVVDHVDRPTEN